MKKTLVLWLVSVTFLLNACHPGGPEAVEDLDVVLTSYDPQFNFSTVKTYVLIDSIIQVDDRSNSSNNVLIRRDLDSFILTQVANNLNSLGYTRLDSITAGQKPDIVVQVSANATTNVGAYTSYNYWDYWGWYPGWSSYGSFGSGWSSYPIRTTSLYSYNTGTLQIDMVNPNLMDATSKQIPVVWRAALQSILTSSAANMQSRLGPGISKAFQQSPYL